jgi:hypothetical protein
MAALAVGAAGALVAVACIPDLPSATSPVNDASVDASTDADAQPPPPPAPPRCGDGIVDLDLGEQCDPGTAPDATSTVCSACQMTCPDAGGFVWPQNNHCYSYDGTQAPDLDDHAANHCQAAATATHVVTFASEAEFQAVVAALRPGAFWVGFDPVAGIPNEYTALASYEPGWAPTCPGCFAHTDNPTSPLPGATAACVEALADAAALVAAVPVQRRAEDRRRLRARAFRVADAALRRRHLRRPALHAHAEALRLRLDEDGRRRGGGRSAGPSAERWSSSQSRDEREQLWYALERMGGAAGLLLDRVCPAERRLVVGRRRRGRRVSVPLGQQAAGRQSDRAPTSSRRPRWLPHPLDITLAHNDVDVVSGMLTFVCQIPATDGGLLVRPAAARCTSGRARRGTCSSCTSRTP